MARAPGVVRFAESTGQLQLHVRYLRAQPALATTWNVVARLGGCLLSRQEFAGSKSGFDQTAARSSGVNHLPSSDPTSTLSGFRCSRSEVFASYATPSCLRRVQCVAFTVESTIQGRHLCQDMVDTLKLGLTTTHAYLAWLVVVEVDLKASIHSPPRSNSNRSCLSECNETPWL